MANQSDTPELADKHALDQHNMNKNDIKTIIKSQQAFVAQVFIPAQC